MLREILRAILKLQETTKELTRCLLYAPFSQVPSAQRLEEKMSDLLRKWAHMLDERVARDGRRQD
eukprot:2725975-Prorocentrum_lima.AAC.1